MSQPDTIKSEIATRFGTPCMVVDLDVVERNIARAQARCDTAGVANRPHIKTHKSPVLAKMQIDAGARGITCQKVGEAAVMVDAGIDDIVIATNVISAARCGDLSALLARAPVKICADNATSLNAYAEAAKSAGCTANVMVECDTGQRRAGVVTPAEALELIDRITSDPRLHFAGLLYYPPLDGWPATQAFHDAVCAGLVERGGTAEIVSTGGTPNFVHIDKLSGATEHRAGTCIFNDRMMIAAGIATREECALTVYASVVSRASPERGILDAGSKTLTSDTGGGLDGHGEVIEHPGARIHRFAEEHGFLDLSQCEHKPAVGDVVRVIPNHVCVVVNMVDQLVAVRGDEIVDVLAVAARGKLV